MWQKIVSFFMAIFAFFASLFGIGGNKNDKSWVYMNEKYGVEERQTMNLYIPKNNDGSCGLILMIHGGAWIEGSKESYPEDTLKYVSNDLGMAAAAINYRYISDTINVNDILDDIDAALKAIKAKGAENNVDINRVMLTGSSAGAHLSLLYAYSRKDTAPIKPTCVVSNCAPTNLADISFYYNNDLGDINYVCSLMSAACGYKFTESTFNDAVPYLNAVSPLSYVTSDSVPTVIAHGVKDTIVPYVSATDLDAKLTQAGVKHDFVTFPNSNHGLESDPDCSQKVNDLMYSYAMEYVK
ncbi:MAG: alpha/beta hydrolase [Ruminococcus sp.]|nr:alpha/beta hydrolase [Ruminococcus sp.]